VLADFMAAVCGPGAAAGACERSVAAQLSTMPSWLYVGGHCPNGSAPCLPPDAWDTQDPYDQYVRGRSLVDPTCQQMARYVARVVGWHTKGGFMDECGHFHKSGLNYSFWGLSILNEDEHFIKPDDGTAYDTCYDAISSAVAKVNPAIVPIGPEICGPSTKTADGEWHLNFILHHLDPSKHVGGKAPAVASFHWDVRYDNKSLSRPFVQWDEAISSKGAVTAIEAARKKFNAGTEMVLNEYIPYVTDWCAGPADGGAAACPDWQSPKASGGDPDLAHAKGVGINRRTWSWNAAAASFAYIFGTLCELGYKYVGIVRPRPGVRGRTAARAR
jgi:hypothetical protein